MIYSWAFLLSFSAFSEQSPDPQIRLQTLIHHLLFYQQYQQQPIVPMASAVSPLIGPSDGVWETSSTTSGSGGDLSEAREELEYCCGEK